MQVAVVVVHILLAHLQLVEQAALEAVEQVVAVVLLTHLMALVVWVAVAAEAE
jgi:hypothetical protein